MLRNSLYLFMVTGVLLAIVCLTSSLTYIQPAFSQTLKPSTSISPKDATALRLETNKSLERMKSLLDQADRAAEKAEDEAEWAKDISTIALTVIGIILGLVALFTLIFTWVHTRRIRDYTAEAREFRDRTESYMERASQVISELESVKEEIDRDIDVRKREALQEIDIEKEEAAKFNQLMGSGMAAVANKDYQTALRLFKQALEIDDKSPVALNAKGAVLSEMGRYESALHVFYRIVRDIDPEYPYAWFNIALNWGMRGRKDEMLYGLRKAIELMPEFREEAQTVPVFKQFEDDRDFRALVFEEEAPPASEES